MKGLLLKDFCLLKKQMKLMVVFVIFYAIWAVAAKNTFYDGYHGNSFEYYDADYFYVLR